jgi:hypothetical protein
VTIGIITSLSDNSWTITTHDGTLYIIPITNTLPIPQNATVGDEVVVLGYRHDNTIDVEAIRPLEHGYGGMDTDDQPNQNAPTGMSAAPGVPSNTNQGLMIPAN